MKPYTKTLIALSLVTFATYGMLVWVGATYLTLGEEGLRPFDLRVLGYTAAESQRYIALLTPEQVEIYTRVLRKIDTVFPLLLALWIGWCLWGLTRSLHSWSRVILLVVPASYAVMNYCENALVADMMQQGAGGLEASTVALASSYTVSKFVMLSVAFALLLVMMIRNAGIIGRARSN